MQQRGEILKEKFDINDNEVTIEDLARERSAKRKNRKKSNSSGKETVQVITKDLIRNLM